ncbi:multidrug-efflux transporter [Thermoplasma volcanium GSS1]|uniref:Multidrug-efflux transporter n=1 Tax=Thermoplasma volcanium (strain ATCC 51530 / DSM 4299 / JCM 9571 / NBRC 15438 / GSS1) TaxID=273116 RepID=Q97AZ9_THEVO|nr:MFS transporter [Thermoplasma volcanium]BAB59802.1 multidrug-efflux transporter [Thermoplasma volcanium GSS1]
MDGAYKLLAISVTSIGSFLAVINSTSLLISLPTIMISLHTTFLFIIWVLVIYPLVMTIGSPIFGRYSDFIGRKQLYGLGYIFFTIGSLLASSSINIDMLIAARAIQGLGGSLLFSNSLAIIADAFRQDELKWAIGTNSLIIGFATAIGPLVGGILTVLNWRYVFVFNVPFGIAGYFMSLKIHDIEKRQVKAAKLPSVFFSIFIILLIIYMTFAPPNNWISFSGLAYIISIAVSFILFIYFTGRSENSLIDISLFKIREFAVQAISTFLNSITRYSILLIAIIMLQGPLSLSPLTSSLMVMPYAVALSLASYFVGRVHRKGMEDHLIYAGLFLSFFGSFMLFFVRDASLPFYIGITLVGFGIGIFYTPSNAILMSTAPPNKRGSAAGLRTVILNLGSVIGMSMVFSVVAALVPESALSSAFLGVKIAQVNAVKPDFLDGIGLSFLISGLSSLLAAVIVSISHMKRAKSSAVSTH